MLDAMEANQDRKSLETQDGATVYVLGESQALNFELSDPDQEAAALARAAASPIQ